MLEQGEKGRKERHLEAQIVSVHIIVASQLRLSRVPEPMLHGDSVANAEFSDIGWATMRKLNKLTTSSSRAAIL